MLRENQQGKDTKCIYKKAVNIYYHSITFLPIFTIFISFLGKWKLILSIACRWYSISRWLTDELLFKEEDLLPKFDEIAKMTLFDSTAPNHKATHHLRTHPLNFVIIRHLKGRYKVIQFNWLMIIFIISLLIKNFNFVNYTTE